MEGAVCSNSVSLESFLSSFMEAVVLETAIAASKALALSLHMGFLGSGVCVMLYFRGAIFARAWRDFLFFVYFAFMIGSLSDESSVLPEESGTSPGFPLTELLPKKKSDLDNHDGRKGLENFNATIPVIMEGLVCSNAVVVEGFLSSIIETVVLETAIAAWKAFALSLFMVQCLCCFE
ncbi:hypothetical protein DKX38_027788 [Salix brachista]|uniref:Uncharacterized protein n=3 Tax=Salix TaxID=40685 RepID=A0A5N5J578_9ROSI|nr:hypothetical protein DKX38_027788 [Salix brachista]